ncbi:unnamed protein product [Gemmata massiliana]|uniref:Uncharacterized protein n=1 Tax=Gemmata massiliana TaxID=1210884 RepID=A0A6P2CWX9_9BACT|nr:unnamed protein product [Gemmata massiliana]
MSVGWRLAPVPPLTRAARNAGRGHTKAGRARLLSSGSDLLHFWGRHARCITTFAKPAGSAPAQNGESIVADTIREKIENAGEAVKDAAKKAGEKIKDGAETVAEKTSDAAKSAGQAVKDAGQKLKDKSGA